MTRDDEPNHMTRHILSGECPLLAPDALPAWRDRLTATETIMSRVERKLDVIIDQLPVFRAEANARLQGLERWQSALNVWRSQVDERHFKSDERLQVVEDERLAEVRRWEAWKLKLGITATALAVAGSSIGILIGLGVITP